jgi:hypothetical protein
MAGIQSNIAIGIEQSFLSASTDKTQQRIWKGTNSFVSQFVVVSDDGLSTLRGKSPFFRVIRVDASPFGIRG